MTIGYNRALSAASQTAVPVPGRSQVYQQASNLFGQLGNYAAQREAEIRARQEGVERVKLQGAYDVGLTARTARLDPLAPDYLDRVNQAHQDTVDELQDRIGQLSEGSRADLEAKFLSAQAALNVSALETREKAVKADATQTLSVEREETLAAIAQDPDGYDQYVDEFGANVTAAGSVFTELERKVLAEQFANDAVAAKAEGLAKSGDIEGARKWLKANEGSLDRAQVSQIGAGINAEESRQRTEFARATARQLADLQIAVTTAETVGELAQAEAGIRQADKLGLFKDREGARANLIAQLHNVRKGLVRVARDQSAFAERMARGDVVQSDQEAELAWAMVEQDQADVFQANPAKRLARLEEFVQYHGRLPPQIKTTIERAERVGDQQSLTIAATLARVVDEGSNGQVKTGAGPRTDSTLAVADALGIELDEAAAFVLANDLTEERRKANEKALKEAAPDDYSPTQWLADELDVEVDQIPLSMGDEFAAAVQTRFMMTGDFDLATAAAMRQMERRFGQTAVGDPGRYQRLPPENFLSGPIVGYGQDERAKLIDLDVRQFLNSISLQHSRAGADEVRYRLTPDERTEREIGLDVPPSYILSVESEAEGVFVPIVNNDTGLPLRYRLPDAEDARRSPYVQELIRSSLPLTARPEKRDLGGRLQTQPNIRPPVGDPRAVRPPSQPMTLQPPPAPPVDTTPQARRFR